MAKETYKERKAREAAAREAQNDNAEQLKPEREEGGYKVNSRDGTPSELKSSTVALRYIEDTGAADPAVTEKTWIKIKSIIDKTPGARERLLGASAGTATVITPKMVEPFYSAIGMINTVAARYLMKIPAEVAGAVVPYNAQELESMSEVTAAAVNENLDKIPAWLLDLLRGGGNVAFGKMLVVLFVIHQQKLEVIKAAQKQAKGEAPAQVVQ
jgi:hypothetical protein